MDSSEVAKMGADARNANMTAEQRSDAARKAVEARWKKYYRENPAKRKIKKARRAA